MKSFLSALKLSFSIVGAVIGAGFISGREIVSFFYGQDVFFVATFVFVGFFLTILFFFFGKNVENNLLFNLSQPFLLAAELVMMSGMLAAIGSFQQQFFTLDAKIPILAAVCVIISNIVLYFDVDGIEKVNAFLVPFMLFVVLIATLPTGEFNPPTTFAVKPFNLVSYTGLNVYLSSVLIMRLGSGEKMSVKILSAIISSLIIAATIYIIGSSLFTEERSVLSADIPLLALLKDFGLIYYPFCAALAFGVFTTLLSSHYPLFLFVENGKWTVFNRIILSVVALIISETGFYNIVSYFYPAVGVFGAVVITALFVSTVFFPQRQRRRTSDLRANIK